MMWVGVGASICICRFSVPTNIDLSYFNFNDDFHFEVLISKKIHAIAPSCLNWLKWLSNLDFNQTLMCMVSQLSPPLDIFIMREASMGAYRLQGNG